MDKYAYLIVNIGSILLPFIFAFHPRIRFDKEWKRIIPAILLPAIPLIIWDELFTQNGIWGFNEDYLIGASILSLPIEEILFFIAIPFACLFTYHVFLRHVKLARISSKAILIGLGLLSAVLVVVSADQMYTLVVSGFVLLSVGFLLSTQSAKGNSSILLVFLVLLIPFLIVNGILTGAITPEPIVWYDDMHHLGIRLGTIPINDILYAFVMLAPAFGIYNLLGKELQPDQA